jgi:IMP dehydrogenase
VREVARTRAAEPTETRHAGRLAVGALVRTDPSVASHVERLVEAGVSLVAIDSIHVAPHRHVETLQSLKRHFPDLAVMSGNVVHADDCRVLIENGADCIRLGYGSGSVNDGLVALGTGRPLARSIAECAPVCHRARIPLVADGGIHSSGQIALALALGADAVMLGRMFAACSGTPGTFELNERGEMIKHYRGMSRRELIDDGMPAEGRDLELRCSGTLAELTRRLTVNLRNSVARAGCRRLSDLFAGSEVELLTQAARRELGVGS